MVEQSCTYNDKQEVTAMGLEHKALPDNTNTLDKEVRLFRYWNDDTKKSILYVNF